MTPSPLRLAETALRATAPLRLLSGPRRSPSSVSPTFYQPPEPLGPGAPGELIRAEEMDAYLVPGIRIRARTWRVLYRSTAATGEPTAVSGTVLLPWDRAGGHGPCSATRSARTESATAPRPRACSPAGSTTRRV